MQATENTQRTPCEIFSRSMGFIRPVSNFNIGKYSEFCERKTFTEANSLSAGQRHCELMKKAMVAISRWEIRSSRLFWW